MVNHRAYKERSLVTFPVRKWEDWLRAQPPHRNKPQDVSIKLSTPVGDWNLVKSAIAYELSLGRRLSGGHSLSRSQVNISKKKAWRQKGTGRARSGSKSSPLCKGGGVVFGPTSRVFKGKAINKKIWKAAVGAALYNKRGNMLVVQGPWHQTVKPTYMGVSDKDHVIRQLSLLGTLGKTNYLVILPNGVSICQFRSSNLMPNVQMVSFSTLKCVDVLRSDLVLLLI